MGVRPRAAGFITLCLRSPTALGFSPTRHSEPKGGVTPGRPSLHPEGCISRELVRPFKPHPPRQEKSLPPQPVIVG